MRTSANRAPNGVTETGGRSKLKVVSELAFTPGEDELRREILEALGERARLLRASATAVLLGLLALLFAGNAIAVTMGVATPSLAGRIALGGALLLVGAEMALIAHGLRTPARPTIVEPPAREVQTHQPRAS